MPRLPYVLCLSGSVLGIVAESIDHPELAGLDAAVGFALLVLGCSSWLRGGVHRIGPAMLATGLAWFFGTLWGPAVYLHRAPLALLLLSYPRGQPSGRVEQAAVLGACAYAALYTVGSNDVATVLFAATLVALVARRWQRAGGPERRARQAALAGAGAFGLVLTLGASARLAGINVERANLIAYDVVVLLVAVGLFADSRWGRWTVAAVTSLVIELGASAARRLPLRDRLARTVGDPTLEVAYHLPELGGYVDEVGRPLAFPFDGDDRAITPVLEDGRQVALLIHDQALLDDPELVVAVTAVTRLAVSNVRLQAVARRQALEIDVSRRRIVEAADEQRRGLERRLREGAGQRLERVEQLVAEVDPILAGQVSAARRQLDEFARGIHPATLASGGLAHALADLAARSGVRVEFSAPPERFAPALEAAAYFVCSEALTNIAKHAAAGRAVVTVVADAVSLTVDVWDDGVGGADPADGTGIRGLVDRVEALGGRLAVESKPGLGTRLRARLPLSPRGRSQAADSACSDSAAKAWR